MPGIAFHGEGPYGTSKGRSKTGLSFCLHCIVALRACKSYNLDTKKDGAANTVPAQRFGWDYLR